MKMQLLSSLFILYFVTFAENADIRNNRIQSVNNEPVIGILAQEISYRLNKTYPNQYKSFISASYVKFVESGGAKVVPIWIGRDETYYENVMSKINGVLLPGGATYFNQSNGYADAGEQIYKIAKRLNKEGDYFPIFGICLGFELLTHLEANRVEHRSHCSSQKQNIPLEFTPGFNESRMFKNAPKQVIKILKKENVTANYHKFCLTTSDLEKVHLLKEFRIMSVNRDFNNFEFISTIEHNKSPFYGVQFHPEKISYEWARRQKIPHGMDATIVSQYFANFFVNEARKNFHTFQNEEEEMLNLIYNYPVTYTALKNVTYLQCYLFN